MHQEKRKRNTSGIRIVKNKKERAKKMKHNESIWKENLERFKRGGFGSARVIGDADYEQMLLAYWRAQEEAGYPGALSNVKYFENIIENKKSTLLTEVQEQSSKLLAAELRVIAYSLRSEYCRAVLNEAASRLEDTTKIATFFRNKVVSIMEGEYDERT